MENPIAAVKSGISVKNVIGVAVGFWVASLILDLLGLTDWLFRPASKIKAAFSKTA